jgi:hypothetical protein
LSSLISSLLDKDGRAEKVFVRKYTHRHGNLMQYHFLRGKKTPKFLQTPSTVLAPAHYRNNGDQYFKRLQSAERGVIRFCSFIFAANDFISLHLVIFSKYK